MKNIVHVLYSGLGGHGSVFFSLAKADTAKEFNTSAVFCGVEEVREDYLRQCKDLGIPNWSVKKKKGLDLSFYTKTYRAIRATRPDIIFLHSTSYILPALWYKIFHRKTRIMVRETQAHHLKGKMEWKWLRLSARYADTIVFLTPESRDDAYKAIPLKRFQRIGVVIPNGLDTELYRPAPPRDTTREWVIGMQSRMQPIKDHATLLKAFAQLVQQTPDIKLTLKIAGDGVTMASTRQLATDLSIAEQVEFAGMLGEHQLLGFMQSLDIYVHATFGETMSNSIMQALACGLPVIASNVWGVNNMISHNSNGLLYESENVNDLVTQINHLIRDTSTRQRLSSSARNFAEEEYALPVLFKKYFKLFKQ
ncbi:MAG: glycosyltransferase family 4 protein [Bacteroidetes bacterium]|nr:glycosyltransferase family 4 protein [Bacteroidota bacterium]